MKQFNKYGVAAAVAAVAASGTFATTISDQDLGDAAIVPYYTVNGNYRTGVHIVNTSALTQVVKYRMRRGSDSRDALDFNIIMSPYDEWTASIAKVGDDIVVTTDDNTCTAPLSSTGQFVMPSTGINAREGAEEGYIEIIGMGSHDPLTSVGSISANAVHVDGTPVDCATVEKNFFRLPRAGFSALTNIFTGVAAAGATSTYNGVHNSEVTSNGKGNTGSVNVFGDTGNVLKVSFFVRNTVTGSEAGDNAVHLEDFASQPMMTNQQLVGFSNGVFQFDPFNFELPNLLQGSYINGTGRLSNHTGPTMDSTAATGALFQDVRLALAAGSIVNDYSNRPTGDFTVATDWVVTLPGQYTMNDGVCALYLDFTGTACGTSTVTVDTDEDDLPVVLQISYWDREEGQQTLAEGGLSVSPGGTGSNAATLDNEVNVIVWGEGDGVLASGDYKYNYSLADGFENGWAQLTVTSNKPAPGVAAAGAGATGNYDTGARAFVVGAAALVADSDVPRAVSAATQAAYGTWVSVDHGVPIVGDVVWEKQDATAPSANYSRMYEHSYTN